MTQSYQLEVTLRGTKPPVWRRIAVPGSLSRDRVHLHAFTSLDTDFGATDQDGWGVGPDAC